MEFCRSDGGYILGNDTLNNTVYGLMAQSLQMHDRK